MIVGGSFDNCVDSTHKGRDRADRGEYGCCRGTAGSYAGNDTCRRRRADANPCDYFLHDLFDMFALLNMLVAFLSFMIYVVVDRIVIIIGGLVEGQ